jgi:hypothetical protein
MARHKEYYKGEGGGFLYFDIDGQVKKSSMDNQA